MSHCQYPPAGWRDPATGSPVTILPLHNSSSALPRTTKPIKTLLAKAHIVVETDTKPQRDEVGERPQPTKRLTEEEAKEAVMKAKLALLGFGNVEEMERWRKENPGEMRNV